MKQEISEDIPVGDETASVNPLETAAKRLPIVHSSHGHSAFLNSLSPWTEELISIGEAEPEFYAFLAKADWATLHYISAVLSIAEIDYENSLSLNFLAQDLMFARRRQIIERHLGNYAQGTLGVFKKLRPKLMQGRTYRQLFEVLQNDKSRKMLIHASSLNWRTIRTLALLNPAYHEPVLIRFLSKRGRLYPFRFITEKIKSLYPDISDQDLVYAVRSAKREGDIGTLLDKYLLRRVRFPEPPFAGTPDFRPITDLASLEQAAREFRNCAADYKYDVVAGRTYIFRWYGDEAAIVKIDQRSIGTGWFCDEALGHQNSQLSLKTLTEISRDLSDNGVFVSFGLGRCPRRFGSDPMKLDRVFY